MYWKLDNVESLQPFPVVVTETLKANLSSNQVLLLMTKHGLQKMHCIFITNSMILQTGVLSELFNNH